MLTAICDVMLRCYEKGWITTRDGNASVRLDGKPSMFITPSGIRKNTVRVEDLIKLKIEGNELMIPQGAKPSGELHMHWLLQRGVTGTRAVLHVHPTNVIAALHAGWDLQELCKPFAEIYRYTRVGPNVPAIPAVTEKLGVATYLAMCPTDSVEFDIVGQVGHGICAVAQNPWEAYEHVERLEHICEIVLKSGVKPPTSQSAK